MPAPLTAAEVVGRKRTGPRAAGHTREGRSVLPSPGFPLPQPRGRAAPGQRPRYTTTTSPAPRGGRVLLPGTGKGAWRRTPTGGFTSAQLRGPACSSARPRTGRLRPRKGGGEGRAGPAGGSALRGRAGARGGEAARREGSPAAGSGAPRWDWFLRSHFLSNQTADLRREPTRAALEVCAWLRPMIGNRFHCRLE